MQISVASYAFHGLLKRGQMDLFGYLESCRYRYHLASADIWTDGGSVQNASYAAGDKMEIMIASVSGSPTQIAIQVDLQLA